MVSVTFTWNSVGDARSCKKCKSLQGYTWTFTDEMPTVLEHPQFGVVWDLVTDQTRTHGLQVHHCRCWLTTEIDDSDVYYDLSQLENKSEKLNETLDSALDSIQGLVSILESV